MKPMKTVLPRSLLILAFVAACAFGVSLRAASVDSPELLQARSDLVDLFKRGQTDEDNGVKQLRAKIAALEFIAQNSPADATTQSRLITVNFSGGPFSALIAATEKSSPGVFNVVGEKADLAIELPPFSVRNADVSSLASALTAMLQPRGYMLASNGRTQNQSSVFTLRKLFSYEAANLDRPSVFQSVQLAPYLQNQSVDDIVGAIHAAWELDPKHPASALNVKFHPPTGILLVSGPGEALIVVQAVLGQLSRSTDQSPKKNPANPSPSPAVDKK
jgi:hypothetical protein